MLKAYRKSEVKNEKKIQKNQDGGGSAATKILVLL
jgi:hypothetical protein